MEVTIHLKPKERESRNIAGDEVSLKVLSSEMDPAQTRLIP
jgi:hypothetical protein